jgi:predicted membrane protein
LWDIAVSPDPTLALSTEMGAGEIRIDASGLNLESLKAAAGAGDVQVVVPSGTRSVTLSAAVGQLGIRVPQGAAVRLEASTLAGNVQVPDGYRKVGSAYLSPGFAEQGAIEIDASLVFGTIILTEE